jgi:hypothetical protein
MSRRPGLAASVVLALVSTAGAGEPAREALPGARVIERLELGDRSSLSKHLGCDCLVLLVSLDVVACAGQVEREKEAWLELEREFGNAGLSIYLVLHDALGTGRLAEASEGWPLPVLRDPTGVLAATLGVRPDWSPTKVLLDCRGRLLYLGLAAPDRDERQALRTEILKAMVLWRDSRDRAAPTPRPPAGGDAAPGRAPEPASAR